MGKYKKGILGYFRGKVGTVVGAVIHGIHYMRSLPDTTDNPTSAQLNVRARMILVMQFLRRLKDLINIGYQQFNKGGSPMNAATGYHLKNAVTGTNAANYAINYEKVMFSVGDLLKPVGLATAATATGKIDFSWANNAPASGTGGTDMATFVVYCKTRDELVTLQRAVPRSALTYSLQLPPEFSQLEMECWMSFVSVDGKRVSDSVYIGQQMVV